MSAKYQNLFEIKYVTDHDCGNYAIGEIDFGVYQGVLREYLINRGRKGKEDIVKTLALMIYMTESEFRSIDDIEVAVRAAKESVT